MMMLLLLLLPNFPFDPYYYQDQRHQLLCIVSCADPMMRILVRVFFKKKVTAVALFAAAASF
jgi:hypothetical protein